VKQDAKAVAEGVRESWSRGNSIDLNSASREQLQSLPGITPKMSESIVAHRPYSSSSELVDRHILSKQAYDKIADRVEVKH
jgi:competence protein ComEA